MKRYRAKHRRWSGVYWMLAAVVAVALAPPAHAQVRTLQSKQATAVQSLVIEDGVMRINEEVVAPDDIPEGLDLRGLRVRLQFAGSGVPVVELDGRRYVLDGQQLRPLDGDERRTAAQDVDVFFRDDRGRTTPASQATSVVPTSGAHPDLHAFVEGLPVNGILEEARALEDAVRRLGDRRVRSRDVARLERRVESLREQAEQLTRMEAERYFAAIQQRNHRLYEQLQREWQLEAEVQRLVEEARSGTDAERRRAEEVLRARLETIFDLKQENRRREVEQLQEQLETLRDQLAQREQFREQIIDRYLQELTRRTRDDGE